MHKVRLESMTKGWFIGNFTPTLFATEAVEVAIKEYPAGSSEKWHYHKIATEFTAIVIGKVEMNGVTYGKGDIIVIPPGEGSNFVAVTDTVTAVVKIPGATNDKYFQEES